MLEKAEPMGMYANCTLHVMQKRRFRILPGGIAAGYMQDACITSQVCQDETESLNMRARLAVPWENLSGDRREALRVAAGHVASGLGMDQPALLLTRKASCAG